MLKQPLVCQLVQACIPAAFRRLCVETMTSHFTDCFVKPAAFRRLCVETYPGMLPDSSRYASRLQAAVC